MNDKLPTARELIAKIRPDRANFDYCGQNGKINGGLLLDIEKAIESHTAAHTAALREEITDLERENDHIREVYDSVERDRDALREKAKELEKEHNDYVEMIPIWQKKIHEQRSRADAAESENTRYRQALESIAARWNKVAEHNDMRTALHLIQQDVFEALKNNEG